MADPNDKSQVSFIVPPPFKPETTLGKGNAVVDIEPPVFGPGTTADAVTFAAVSEITPPPFRPEATLAVGDTVPPFFSSSATADTAALDAASEITPPPFQVALAGVGEGEDKA